MEKKIHLFHWTKKSFSLLHVLPLTGKVMGLDHVHIHSAVNQECHSPHLAKNIKLFILQSVKEYAEALTSRTWEGSLSKRLRISAKQSKMHF